MAAGIIALEVNEVPPFLWREFIGGEPTSAIAAAFRDPHSILISTSADDVDETLLYPSQTWASFYSGRPYDAHKVHWYSDTKDFSCFFWEELSRLGYTVGLVNTLHSSPGSALVNDNIRFLIPDCFATDAFAKPTRYESFQHVNTNLTKESGRSISLKRLVSGSAIAALRRPSEFGISQWTVSELLGSFVGVLIRGKSRETLRNMQFPLLGQLFIDLISEHAPQYSSLFTNHVAANMHRFWYAAFPEHFESRLYDDRWIARNRDNIRDALRLFDRFFLKIIRIARAQDKVILISTSMGQQANKALTSARTRVRHDVRLAEPLKLIKALDINIENIEVGINMVPQYSFVLPTEESARELSQQLNNKVKNLEILSGWADLKDKTVTLSIFLKEMITKVTEHKKMLTDLGFAILPIDDHHSGKHHPTGTLIVFNDRSGWFKNNISGTITYLDVHDLVIKFFTENVEPQASTIGLARAAVAQKLAA